MRDIRINTSTAIYHDDPIAGFSGNCKVWTATIKGDHLENRTAKSREQVLSSLFSYITTPTGTLEFESFLSPSSEITLVRSRDAEDSFVFMVDFVQDGRVPRYNKFIHTESGLKLETIDEQEMWTSYKLGKKVSPFKQWDFEDMIKREFQPQSESYWADASIVWNNLASQIGSEFEQFVEHFLKENDMPNYQSLSTSQVKLLMQNMRHNPTLKALFAHFEHRIGNSPLSPRMFLQLIQSAVSEEARLLLTSTPPFDTVFVPTLNNAYPPDTNALYIQSVVAPGFTLKWTYLTPSCLGDVSESSGTTFSQLLGQIQGFLGDYETRKSQEGTNSYYRKRYLDALCDKFGLCDVTGSFQSLLSEEKKQSFGSQEPSPGFFDKFFHNPHEISSLRVLPVASAAMSNLLGSITKFTGKMVQGRPVEESRGWGLTYPDFITIGDLLTPLHIQNSPRVLPPPSMEMGTETDETFELVTGVPSRSFFPRGFLWDEGFHQVIVSQWNQRLSLAVLHSWMKLMKFDPNVTIDDMLPSKMLIFSIRDILDSSSDHYYLDAEIIIGSQADIPRASIPMNHGWIPREQILGDEARARVPVEFRTQRVDVANPPTLLFPILSMAVDSLCTNYQNEFDGDPSGQSSMSQFVVGASGDSENIERSATPTQKFCMRHTYNRKKKSMEIPACRFACRDLRSGSKSNEYIPPSEMMKSLQDMYPKLLAQYQWFKRTQGGERMYSFRWRGNTRDHSFASGLDDFPRGRLPTFEDENVDLLAWLSFYSNVLGSVATALGRDSDAQLFDAEGDIYLKLMNVRHWNSEHGMFCDIGLPFENPNARSTTEGGNTSRRLGHVCHEGYVPLIPFFMRMVDPASPQMADMLKMMKSEGMLSPYGLRSLSSTSKFFKTKENYWRGAIWINMNYLAVSSLNYYSKTNSPWAQDCAALAKVISDRVIAVIVREYETSGFIHENYDSETGKGRGTFPFTGWSALVVLLSSNIFPF